MLSEVIDADGRVSSGIPLKEFLKGLKFSNSFSYEILNISNYCDGPGNVLYK